MNRLFLQIEGFMVFILSIGYYSINEYNWWLFAILLLAPDVSMVGYFIIFLFASFMSPSSWFPLLSSFNHSIKSIISSFAHIQVGQRLKDIRISRGFLNSFE